MLRDAQTESNAARRDFLKAGATVAVAGTLGMNLSMSAGLYAAGNEILKVGLVGCGGRGTGAAREALKADPQTRLVAMGDAFPEQIEGSINSLKGVKEIGDRVVVDADHKFSGLEAYKHVIDNVDVVLLASPPGFRPYHLRYAVEKGKNIFTEKPMATDAPGVRSVMETVKMAKEKKLALVAGFCWRYDYPRRELFKRIHDGQIGDVIAVYGTYLTSPVKPMPPADTRPKGMSDLEWMVRNWYNFTWLSGDGLVEQAIHTVDWLAWTMKDVPAVSCTAVGGRQIPAHGGNIYDHIEVNYLWESGTRGFLSQRQIAGCHNENNLYVLGAKGTGSISGRGVTISGENAWKYSGPTNNMYQTEHDEFFASIRSGNPINDGDRMVKSTLLGIMGRMAGYTGQQVTWDMALNSQEELVPDVKDWNADVKMPTMARPGVTPFV
jgi:myo-inositol 2-dehydrogenase/D-chiro-inositol 1-dehydrogenase